LCGINIEKDVTNEELVQLEREVVSIVEDDDPSFIDINEKIVEESTPPTSHS
jgi:hypothetical protein